MRLRSLACAFTLASLAGPALAQDGFDAASAVEEFLTNSTTLGATEATVGEVTQADGTVTAQDVRMQWTATVPAEGETATISAAVTIPTLTVTGLEQAGEGYAVEEIAIPAIEITFAVTGTDQPFSFDLDVSDYRIVNAEWDAFPVIQPNPAAPVSRFAPLVHWALGQSYELNAVGGVTGTVVDGDDEQTFAYGPLSVGPVEDGTLAEFTYGEITAKQTVDVPDGNGGTTEGEVTITYGPITGRNLDMKPFAALLTGIEAGDERARVAENLTVEKVVAAGGEEFSFSVGNIVIEDFTVDPTRGPLMAKFDQFVLDASSGAEPDPVSMVDLMLDLYGAYGFGLYSIQNIEASGPDFTLSVGDVRTEGLSGEGLDRFAVLDVSVNTTDGSGTLGEFTMGGFTWPEREGVMAALMQSMAGAQPTPEAILAAIPTLGHIAVRGLSMDAVGLGKVELGTLALELGGYVGAIPTSLAIVLEGLVMPASMLPDPNTAMMAEMIGADPISADGRLSLRWDEDTQRFELEEDVAVANVGRLQTDATLSGIPRTIFEDPTQAQAALATAAVNGLTIRFEDAGLTQFALGMIGQQAGVSAAEFAEGIASQVGAQLGAITGDAAFAGNVADAVRTFLTDPQSLTVSADPANPVPVAQIMGAAMTAPAAPPAF